MTKLSNERLAHIVAYVDLIGPNSEPCIVGHEAHSMASEIISLRQSHSTHPKEAEVTVTEEMVERWAALLEKYDAARENQKENGADIALIILGNYGDLALQELRALVAALSRKG